MTAANKCPSCRSLIDENDACPNCTLDSEYGPFYGECIFEIEHGPRAQAECGRPFIRPVGDGLMCTRHLALTERREDDAERLAAGRSFAQVAGDRFAALFLGGGAR